MSKNTLGSLCMVSAFFLIWTFVGKSNLLTERKFNVKYQNTANLFVLVLTFFLLKGPQGISSATSIVVLIIGLPIFLMIRRLQSDAHLGKIILVFFLLTGAGYLILWQGFNVNPVEIVASLTNRVPTLTGRNVIWDKLFPVAMQNSVLGSGYGGYWIEPLVFDKLTINQAHNGYLDIFIELGVVGLILFTIVIVAFFRKAIAVFKCNIDWGAGLLTFLIMSLLHNITESTFLQSTFFIWNVLILIIVGSPKNAKVVPIQTTFHRNFSSEFERATSDHSKHPTVNSHGREIG